MCFLCGFRMFQSLAKWPPMGLPYSPPSRTEEKAKKDHPTFWANVPNLS